MQKKGGEGCHCVPGPYLSFAPTSQMYPSSEVFVAECPRLFISKTVYPPSWSVPQHACMHFFTITKSQTFISDGEATDLCGITNVLRNGERVLLLCKLWWTIHHWLIQIDLNIPPCFSLVVPNDQLERGRHLSHTTFRHKMATKLLPTRVELIWHDAGYEKKKK